MVSKIINYVATDNKNVYIVFSHLYLGPPVVFLAPKTFADIFAILEQYWWAWVPVLSGHQGDMVLDGTMFVFYFMQIKCWSAPAYFVQNFEYYISV